MKDRQDGNKHFGDPSGSSNKDINTFGMNGTDVNNMDTISSSNAWQTVNVLSGKQNELVPLPVNPLIHLDDSKGGSGSQRKRRMKDSPVTTDSRAKTPTSRSLSSRVGSDEHDDYLVSYEKRTKPTSKTNDSDNLVTVTATNSSVSTSWPSRSHTIPTTATTTASSGSGGDDDDRESSLSGSINCSSIVPEKASDKGGGQEKSQNYDRRESSNDTMLSKQDRDGRLNSSTNIRHEQGSHRYLLKYHRPLSSSTSRHVNEDISTLQILGDDCSDRLAVCIEEGNVLMKPATVVASRLFTHTSNCSSSSSTGGLDCELSLSQNQNNLSLHRKPGYHTIRRTFHRYRSSNNNNDRHRSKRKKQWASNDGKPIENTSNNADASSMEETTKEIARKKIRLHHRHQHDDDRDRDSGSIVISHRSKHKRNKKLFRSKRSSAKEGNGEGNSSGSGTDGTEDGYAGSVSSNETVAGNQPGSTSPSSFATSSEECEQADRLKGKHHRDNPKRTSSGTQEGGDLLSSSDIADFSSSGNSETMDEEDITVAGSDERESERRECDPKIYLSSPSQSLTSSNCKDSDELEMSYLSAKRNADAEHERISNTSTPMEEKKNITRPEDVNNITLHSNNERGIVKNIYDGRPPILRLGCDVMAHILTFLQPPDILDILTMPLSKLWRQSFASQPELWRVVCLVEPFKATINDPIYSSSSSVKANKDTEKRLLDKYRLLYTSFVRCMKYISQIREDAVNGRPPAYIDYGISGTVGSGTSNTQHLDNVSRRDNRTSSIPSPPPTVSSNKNLQMFLAQARDVVIKSTKNNNNVDDENKDDDSASRGEKTFPILMTAARVATAVRKTKNMKNTKKQGKTNRPKFGRSMITGRLFGPSPEGEPGHMNLPWSCAIYSIVNWMVAFSDVEGIQTLCLKVLPVLLENEQHRLTAQSAGLADVVLRAMVMFAESAQLNIAAFHTLVLLARPHGGKEGMLFHNSMTADGIFGGMHQQHGKSGIAVMLDSMRRFQDNSALLAMSCWALVNIALVSDQKAVLVKLGGIQAITNAMSRHPFSAELQFRALFALINLVIPSVEKTENTDNANGGDGALVVVAPPRQIVGEGPAAAVAIQEQLEESNETTEKEIIDELVGDIAGLVIRVMKNFCSSEAIINRACLVLHNLSLTEDYHVILLWTPQCYQMLEWCVANYRTDQVLQQSATGTLYRLQSALSRNEEMRDRFSESLRTQQQHMILK